MNIIDDDELDRLQESIDAKEKALNKNKNIIKHNHSINNDDTPSIVISKRKQTFIKNNTINESKIGDNDVLKLKARV